jgi:hypothetical protein
MFAPQAMATKVPPRAPVSGDVLLHPGDAEGAGRFEDAARVLEHVLDGGAGGVGVDRDPAVDQLAGEAEGFGAHRLDRRAIREQADVGERHPLASAHRADHGIRVVRLHPVDRHLGPHRLHVGGDAGDQAAAADGDEDAVDRPGMLAQDLHADRALAGDHVRVVEGVDEGEAPLCGDRLGPHGGVRVAVARELDLGPEPAHGLDLERGVVVGMTTVARQPSRLAARATPWAWLPADAQTTPRARSASGSSAILL